MNGNSKSAVRAVRILWAVLRYLVLVVLCILLGLNAFLVNAEKIGGKAMPMPFGFGVSEVMSGSMEPAVSVGDLLLVAKQDVYRLNEIVVYQSGGLAVVHRIVRIEGNTVVTKGDANSAEDEAIQSGDILGKVVLIVPRMGRVSGFLQTLPGILLLAVAAVLLLELSFCRKRLRDEKELGRIKDEIRRLKEDLEEPECSEGANNCRKDESKN